MMYNFPFFPHFYPKFNRNYPQNSPKYVNNKNNSYPSTYPINNSNNLYRNNSYYNNNTSNYHSNNATLNNTSHEIRDSISYPEKKNRTNSHHTIKDKSHSNQKEKKKDEDRFLDDTEVIFEIFGIQLHFDDILLVCLIFFLYNEGVKDEFLFIALILLLLS